jgi:hypothetical protein
MDDAFGWRVVYKYRVDTEANSMPLQRWRQERQLESRGTASGVGAGTCTDQSHTSSTTTTPQQHFRTVDIIEQQPRLYAGYFFCRLLFPRKLRRSRHMKCIVSRIPTFAAPTNPPHAAYLPQRWLQCLQSCSSIHSSAATTVAYPGSHSTSPMHSV